MTAQVDRGGIRIDVAIPIGDGRRSGEMDEATAQQHRLIVERRAGRGRIVSDRVIELLQLCQGDDTAGIHQQSEHAVRRGDTGFVRRRRTDHDTAGIDIEADGDTALGQPRRGALGDIEAKGIGHDKRSGTIRARNGGQIESAAEVGCRDIRIEGRSDRIGVLRDKFALMVGHGDIDRRGIVDDADDQRIVSRVPIEIDHRDGERNAGSVGVQRIVVERVDVGDASHASGRIVAVTAYHQCAGRIREDLLRQGTGRDDSSRDRNGGHAIGRGESDGAGGGFRITIELAALGFAGTEAELGFLDLGGVARTRHGRDPDRRVRNADDQRGSRRVSVSIGDLIAERVADPARRIGAARVGIAAVGIERQ